MEAMLGKGGGVAFVESEQRRGYIMGVAREWQHGCWVGVDLVKLSSTQGQVYMSDLMATNGPQLRLYLPILRCGSAP